jgi:hypothetical protein
LFGVIFFIDDIFFKMFKLWSPEILITAMADLPVGVDKAYIVS